MDIGCDNCYYSYFDEKAYPCSLCIRGVERTDQWQPSKKTKADRNSSEKPNNCETCRHWKYIAKEWQCETTKCQGYEPKDEPQTNADQHIQSVESVESVEQTERSE